MANPGRGRAIFEQRAEYPLPRKSGVRDYVFYFVPESDGYGRGARYFLNRFYPRHVPKNVASLEALVDALHAEVTGGGVSQIREIIMLAHGTAQGLVLPVLKSASAATLQEYRYLTPFSLAFLQKDFSDGKFAGFRQKRTEVIARLQSDSWVTLRACRFGSSAEGMYALYSFFGGKANVYAPREFQFFGSHPIVEGMRVETRLKVHAHLVKQRFLPGDLHTPERQDAIVKALIDPAKFSESFEIASIRLSNPEPDAVARYEQLIDRLNAERTSNALTAKFVEHGHALTSQATVRVKVKNSAWLIRDALVHGGDTHRVEYDVGEEVGPAPTGGGQVAALRASASIADAYSAREFFPIQLFFYESENNLWKGKLFVLAAHLEEPDADPADKQKFDALLALLNQSESPRPVPDAIKTEFKAAQDLDLSAAARLSVVSMTGTGALMRRTWAVQDGTSRYLIKLEHPASARGIPGHSLGIYSGLEGKARLRHEYELMGFLGQDPDTPGPELPAYLDRLSLDELMELIDHLRAPYRDWHSFYIHHAQQAIRRKKDYFQWWQARYRDIAMAQPLFHQPYSELEPGEGEDKRALVYDFDFNGIWQEVKASHPSLGVFQQDLFAEESLWEKFRHTEDISDRSAVAEVEAESPYTDLEELRRLEAQGFERYFATDKAQFEPAEDSDVSCDEFRAILTRWKELQGTEAEEMKRLLGLEVASDGKTFLDHILHYYQKFKITEILMLTNMFNMAFMRDGILVNLASRIPIIGAPTALGTPTVFTSVLRVLPAITIPLTMWLKFLGAQAEADQVWENTGKLTAIRQWLRQLILLTIHDTLPDSLVIDLGWHGSSEPHVERYYQEQRDEYGSYSAFVWAPDRMAKGFNEGIRLMEQVGQEILDKADEMIADALREWNLDSCRIKVLVDVGLLELTKIKAQAVRQMAGLLLDKLPKV
jgi:hypothetical protein